VTTPPLQTERLSLEPLEVSHAAEMVELLAPRSLYAFYPEEPSPSLVELTERYERQVRGQSADGTQVWHNWILRERSSGLAVGFVQATVIGDTAELAWVLGEAHQRKGFATEAATTVRDAFTTETIGIPVTSLIAHIAPGHTGSESVAQRLGLRPTEIWYDGEIRWHLSVSDS